jgi:hypothetical protein
MNHRTSSQGFTRKELLVAVAIILLSGCCVVAVFLHTLRRDARRGRVNTTSKTGRDIYTVLSAWAADHNGEFPTARQYSNEAFRELFKAKLVDSENLFWISGDAWHKNSPSGDWKMPPDNEIGTAPDFAEALMAGECAWAYVTGLNQQSDPQLPLLANAFSESVGGLHQGQIPQRRRVSGRKMRLGHGVRKRQSLRAEPGLPAPGNQGRPKIRRLLQSLGHQSR